MGRHDEEDEGFEVGEVECIRETRGAKGVEALLFKMIDDMNYMKAGTEFWVPYSQVHDNSDVYKKGDRGSLVVNTWLAEDRGWSDS